MSDFWEDQAAGGDCAGTGLTKKENKCAGCAGSGVRKMRSHLHGMLLATKLLLKDLLVQWHKVAPGGGLTSVPWAADGETGGGSSAATGMVQSNSVLP